jgi:hypothetical protein
MLEVSAMAQGGSGWGAIEAAAASVMITLTPTPDVYRCSVVGPK